MSTHSFVLFGCSGLLAPTVTLSPLSRQPRMPANSAIRQLGRTTAGRLRAQSPPNAAAPRPGPAARCTSGGTGRGRPSRPPGRPGRQRSGRQFQGPRARQQTRAPESRPRGVSRRRRMCRARGESGRGFSASGARRWRGCPGRLSGTPSRFARTRCGWLRHLRGCSSTGRRRRRGLPCAASRWRAVRSLGGKAGSGPWM